MRIFRSAVMLFAVVCSLFAVSIAAYAAPTAPAPRTALQGYVPMWATATNDKGAMPEAQMKNMTIILARPAEKEAALDKLMDQQTTPGSPNFHHWLSPQQLGEQYGPSETQVSAVTAWLAASKLHVDDISNDRTRITFSGDSADVAAAFGVGFHDYVVPTYQGKKKAIAVTNDPQVPAAIAANIAAIAGITTDLLVSDYNAVESPTGTNLHLMTAANFNTVYGITSTLNTYNGAGVRVAVIGQSRVNAADITDFQTLMGLNVNAKPNTIIPPTGSDPGVNGPAEQTLDVNRVMSVAPGAWVDLIVSGDSDGLYTAASYNVNTLLDPIMTLSYGGCEQVQGQVVVTKWTNLFQTATAEGITPIVSSGDSGAVCGNAWTTNDPSVSGGNVPGTVGVISGTVGSGAKGTVTVNSSGVITGVTVTSGGSGYSSAPSIAFYSGGTNGGGSGATAVVASISGVVTQVVVTNGGSGYSANPTLGINYLCSNPYVTCVGGTSFNDGVKVLVGYNPTGVGANALATATVNSSGVITAISPTILGTGYTTAPTVTIVGGGGSGATATASVDTNGHVASYTVTNGGTGYNLTNYWTDSGSTFSTVTGYIPEGAFDEPVNINGFLQVGGSDGGVSQYTSRPTYQASGTSALKIATGVVNGLDTTSKRLVPDIALFASIHDGYFQCINLDCESGKYATVQGTSAAAPSFAGMMALGVQKSGKQGSMNPLLYNTANQGAYGTAYHDITATTSGVASCDVTVPSPCNNSEPYLSGYSVVNSFASGGYGYDMVTGIGSVNGQLIGFNWLNPGNGGNAGTGVANSGNYSYVWTIPTVTFGTQSTVAFNTAIGSDASAVVKVSTTDITAKGTLLYTATSTTVGPVAVTSASVLLPGTYTLRAFWQPDATGTDATTYNVTTGTTTFTVNKPTPTIGTVSLTSPSSTTFAPGTLATLTVTVSGVSGGGTPTGNVQFYDGSTALGSPVAVDNTGKATLQYTFTTTSTPAIKATYAGDTTYVTVTSATALSLTVTKATPAVSAVSLISPSSSTFAPGTTATLSLTVSGSSGTPTGNVQFYNGSTAIGSPVALSSGTAILNYQFTATGSASITATYAGDTIYTSGTSGGSALSLTVLQATLTVTANPTTITITRGNTGTSVFTFTPNGAYSGTVALSCSGLPAFASCSFSSQPVFSNSSTVQTSTLSIYTLAPQAVVSSTKSGLLWIPALLLGALLWLGRRSFNRSVCAMLMLAVLACLSLGVTGCGRTSYATPVGTTTATVTVAATATASTSTSAHSTVSLTVTIQ